MYINVINAHRISLIKINLQMHERIHISFSSSCNLEFRENFYK